jgi:hypothetical protein
MQKDIRESQFPDLNYFVSLNSDNKLIEPADAALNILKQTYY